MAAALRRLVLPTFSRRLASSQPIPSFTGAGKATQANKWTSLRSYRSEAAAREERKERLMYEIARADLLLDLAVWASAALFCYTFYHGHSVERAQKAN